MPLSRKPRFDVTEDDTEFIEGVGEQDAFQRLWTPHRIAYVRAADVRVGPGIS